MSASVKSIKTTLNREAWLNEMATLLRPKIEKALKQMAEEAPALGTYPTKLPKFRVTVGFPSRRGLANKRRVVGECWTGKVSTDGTYEIMTSPLVADEVEVAAILAHELIHTVIRDHKRAFRYVALAIGLTGKMTATVPGDAFKEAMTGPIKKVGDYPHGAMDAGKIATSDTPHYKKQKTYLRKVECPECGYPARVTKQWIESHGTPICPLDKLAMVEPE